VLDSRSPEEARKAMSGMLQQLQSQLAGLKPEAILPDSIFTPRQELIDLEIELQEEPEIQFNPKKDTFTINPLAVLFKRANLPEGARGEPESEEESEEESSAEAEEGEEEEEEEVESGAEQENQGEEGTEDLELGSGEEGIEPDAATNGETQMMAEYILNIGFGNEDLTSTARLTLVAPERLCPVLDWVCGRRYGDDPFRMVDLHRADAAASSDTLKAGILDGVVQVLLKNGLLLALHK